MRSHCRGLSSHACKVPFTPKLFKRGFTVSIHLERDTVGPILRVVFVITTRAFCAADLFITEGLMSLAKNHPPGNHRVQRPDRDKNGISVIGQIRDYYTVSERACVILSSCHKTRNANY